MDPRAHQQCQRETNSKGKTRVQSRKVGLYSDFARCKATHLATPQVKKSRKSLTMLQDEKSRENSCKKYLSMILRDQYFKHHPQ